MTEEEISHYIHSHRREDQLLLGALETLYENAEASDLATFAEVASSMAEVHRELRRSKLMRLDLRLRFFLQILYGLAGFAVLFAHLCKRKQREFLVH